ncbi:MAG: hypothetical protein H6Q89_2305 [Myxococcaceae bacterium]|nr:hypothetical protein [Myxococcaceae bacterium]
MRPFLPRRLLLVAASTSLVACAGFVGIFVSQADAIRVPHARHLVAEVDCGSCHETIFESTNLETRNMPPESKCLSCHKEEKAKGNCGFCHTNPDHPTAIPTRARELKMNHAEHIERVKEDCTVCHQTLPNPLRTAGMAPKMATCLGCHEHQEQFNAGNCAVCHKDLTRYPLQPLSAFTHRPDYLKNHRLDARSSGAVCATCHEQTFCSACHSKTVGARIETVLPERIDRSFIHRNDFFGRHPVEARADQAMCLRCHSNETCTGCHAKNSLTPGSTDSLQPHPPGFGNGAVHGKEARRDIVSCAACHDQGAASNCVSCHKVGGVGGTPHPPSWMLRHRKEEVSRNAMCQICHL